MTDIKMELINRALPDISFIANDGSKLSLINISNKKCVLYIYPMTKIPKRELPDEWHIIPGARGCTSQSCSFRDHAKELAALDAQVYGVSSQATNEQKEAADRLHLPFLLLSDPDLRLVKTLGLPCFHLQKERTKKYYERMTLIIEKNIIRHVIYPISKPEKNAEEVLAYLRSHL